MPLVTHRDLDFLLSFAAQEEQQYSRVCPPMMKLLQLSRQMVRAKHILKKPLKIPLRIRHSFTEQPQKNVPSPLRRVLKQPLVTMARLSQHSVVVDYYFQNRTLREEPVIKQSQRALLMQQLRASLVGMWDSSQLLFFFHQADQTILDRQSVTPTNPAGRSQDTMNQMRELRQTLLDSTL